MKPSSPLFMQKRKKAKRNLSSPHSFPHWSLDIGHWSFEKAFSLVEVTMALGITAFCLIVLFGLLPIGLRSNQAAIGQTAANSLLSAVVADLRATTTGTASQQYSVPIPANPETSSTTYLYFSGDGLCSTSMNGPAMVSATTTQSRYLLTIKTYPNGSAASTDKTATFLSLKVSWPAATLANPSGSVQTFVALDRN